MTAVYYHTSELPWSTSSNEERRFRSIVSVFLVLSVVMSIVFWSTKVPELDRTVIEAVPERLAKLVIEKKQIPKVEEPKPVEKEEEQKKEEPKAEEKKAEEKKPEEVKPLETPQPPKRDEKKLREKAAKSGLLALSDDLADLRDDSLLGSLENKNLVNAPTSAAEGRRERSIIASNATKGSGGISTGHLSRDIGSGSGAGQLATRSTTKVEESLIDKLAEKEALEAEAAKKEGRKAARTHEQIALVIDRYKSKLLSIYQRALRDDPTLRGNVVFELTIAPDGSVTECKVMSSDLHDEALEQKLIARIKMINFDAKDVDTMIVTIPIDFYPQ